MNVQKLMAIRFFPEGIRPAVILYTTLWDAYLNEYLYFFLWKLYFAKKPQQMLSLFQMYVSVPNQQPALKVPRVTLLLARQAAANHSPRAEPGGGNPRQSVQIFWDFSTRTLVPQNLYADEVCVHRGKLFTSEWYRQRPLFCETAL